MSEPLSNDRTNQLLRDLKRCVAERAEAERRFESDHAHGTSIIDAKFRDAIARLDERFETDKSAVEEEFTAARQECLAEYESSAGVVQEEYDAILTETKGRFDSETGEATRAKDDAQWVISSLLDDESESSPKVVFERFKNQLGNSKTQMKSALEEVEQQYGQTVEVMRRRRQWLEADEPEPTSAARNREESQEKFHESLQACRELTTQLTRRKVARLFSGFLPFILLLSIAAPIFAGLFFSLDYTSLGIRFIRTQQIWAMVSAGIGFAVSGTVLGIVFAATRSKSGQLIDEIEQSIADAKSHRERWARFAKRDLKQRQAECASEYKHLEKQRVDALNKSEASEQKKLTESTSRKDVDVAAAELKYPAMLADIEDTKDQRLAELEETYEPQLEEITRRYNQETKALTEEHERSRDKRLALEERDRDAITESWTKSIADFSQAVDDLDDRFESFTPEWETLSDDSATLPTDVPPALHIGRYTARLEDLEDGMPADERLRPERTHFDLPAFLSFPSHPSLLFKANGDGRPAAVDSIRATMLRLLTSLPPGKVRFTVFDPVGLGENFSMFMHLADFDELMIGTRIWTESAHIEKRLADLTEHMENVFQAYLRNEFESIDEYNVQAGEVAEPYQILVAANFPTNFTEASARRLVSIASNGARCGVYTLISVDTKQMMPHNFDLSDLEAHATTFEWKKNRFLTTDRELALLPLALDRPPEAEQFGEIIRVAGRQSKDARRVEVPFKRIVPKSDDYWAQDSKSGVDVPLGRAGAMKLQNLSLGKGTSQHVLVAGKTGSGKSSFLHALITNMALHYSPDHVQFYLIDFKKGVEFKTYATHNMPHTRVIGIESDREFGVSVLERLDSVLKERGDKFREKGVQDVPSYRKAVPGEAMPRLMLVIDEFQEFFVEDDKLSQAATLLLDRLVRQGRAFGIHVILGSQTLGGAYALARSTLGQIAVRIALQCSDSDAHLILSEENSAARLLTRPGEAIYNDANGLLEGNHPFQVAWLPDDTRDFYLQEITRLVNEQQLDVESPIVFEGNVASDLGRNTSLAKVITALSSAGAQEEMSVFSKLGIWLGEAVAIKEPTEISFSRKSGDNMLIVGQQAETARGLLATTFVTLAIQQCRFEMGDAAAQCFVLDGDSITGPESQAWNELSGFLPNRTRIGGQRDCGEFVSAVAAEINRRNEQNDEAAAPMFLFIENLGRFRDLRKDDDDFGFSSMDSDKPADPSKLLGDILRDGPGVGVHTVIWCDTYANVNRWLGSPSIREMEIRVVFQMSATDSSILIDSPIAGNLGEHRALLYLGETGTTEKFRPYGRPSDEWLAETGDQLKRFQPKPSAIKAEQTKDDPVSSESSESEKPGEAAVEPQVIDDINSLDIS